MTKDDERNVLTLTIQTGRGAATHDFEKTAKVEEVIAWAIERFVLSPTEPWEIVRQLTGGAPLEPQRPLVSYGIEAGEVLVVSAAGGGV